MLSSNFCRATGYSGWISLWFSAVSPGKFRNSNSNRLRPLPSKSFPVHHSPGILQLDFSDKLCRKVNRTEELCNCTALAPALPHSATSALRVRRTPSLVFQFPLTQKAGWRIMGKIRCVLYFYLQIFFEKHSLWQIHKERRTERPVGLQVQYPILLSDFIQNWNVSNKFYWNSPV
jgi:hypothetical protein